MNKIIFISITVLIIGFLAWIAVLSTKTATPPASIPTPTPQPQISQTVSTQPTEPQGNIIISSPLPNTTVSLPIVIKGTARVFENQFQYRVLSSGKVVASGSAYAQSKDTGEYGPFTITISGLSGTGSGNLSVELFDNSAKDGSEQDLVKLPLVLTTK